MLELLKQAAPGTTRVAMIYNPDNPGTNDSARSFEQSVKPLGLQAVLRPVHGRDDIERAIVGFAAEPNGALFCPPDVTVNINRELVTTLAVRHRLPAMYGDPLAFHGGLMSYGSDRVEVFRRAASYVDRILRGEKPGDLPVQQPTKYLLTINLSVAKAVHLTLPSGLLALADEVIE
jgi:ABC-type uncharacterized transport system substrate-binding protein